MEDLKDLIINTLDAQGTLGDIRAQLRMLVFKSIDNEGKQVPYDKTPAMQLADSDQGRLCVELLRDFLSFFKLNLSLNVLIPETRIQEEMPIEKLRDLLGFRPEPGSPIIFQIIEKINEPEPVQGIKPDPVQPIKPQVAQAKPKSINVEPVAEIPKPKTMETVESLKPREPPAQKEPGFAPAGMLPIATQAKSQQKTQSREEAKDPVNRGGQGKDLVVGTQGEAVGFQPGLGRAAGQLNPSPAFNFPATISKESAAPSSSLSKEQPLPKPQPQKPAESAVQKSAELLVIPKPSAIPPRSQVSSAQETSASASFQASTQASTQLPEPKKIPPKLAPLKEPAKPASSGRRFPMDEDDSNEREKERLQDIGRTLDQMQRADKLGKQVEIKGMLHDFDLEQSPDECGICRAGIEEDISDEGSLEIVRGEAGKKEESFGVSSGADPSFSSEMLGSYDHYEEAEPVRRR